MVVLDEIKKINTFLFLDSFMLMWRHIFIPKFKPFGPTMPMNFVTVNQKNFIFLIELFIKHHVVTPLNKMGSLNANIVTY